MVLLHSKIASLTVAHDLGYNIVSFGSVLHTLVFFVAEKQGEFFFLIKKNNDAEVLKWRARRPETIVFFWPNHGNKWIQSLSIHSLSFTHCAVAVTHTVTVTHWVTDSGNQDWDPPPTPGWSHAHIQFPCRVRVMVRDHDPNPFQLDVLTRGTRWLECGDRWVLVSNPGRAIYC